MTTNVFSNGEFIAFRYDRDDCNCPQNGQRKCDVIVCEFASKPLTPNCIWLIEIKNGDVDYKQAKSAADQIRFCENITRMSRNWTLKRAVIGVTFREEGVSVLKKANISHFKSSIKPGEPGRKLVEMVNGVYSIF